jgi:hypothetical protein
MRTIWHSDRRAGRLLRLIFVIASFIVSFFAVGHALVFVGVARVDADGVAFIIALMSGAFVMYG